MINDHGSTADISADMADTQPLDGSRSDTMDTDEVISTLNGLIETCRDGQEGFKQAAEGCDRSDLKTFFNACSLERASFVGELQSLVRELGGEAEDGGSFAGSIHRGWMDIKTAIAGNDDEAVLSECERGEDAAKSNYNEAVRSNLPGNVRAVVEQQAASVRDKHDRIKALRDFSANKGSSALDGNDYTTGSEGYTGTTGAASTGSHLS